MMTLLKNKLVQLGLVASLAFGIGLCMGYIDGRNSERLNSLQINLDNLNVAKQKYEASLAKKESELINLAKTNTILRGNLKNEKDSINRTNTIRGNFVRVVSADAMSKTTATTSAESTTVLELESIPASRIASYIIELKNHDDVCVIMQNALVDSVNEK